MAQAELHVVGDVFLNRTEPEAAFNRVVSTLSDADLRIGNYEASFSNAGEQSKFRPWSNFLYSPPEMIRGVTTAGFDVVSLANNQMMNYGPDGLLDTLQILSEHDVCVTGAGVDVEDAETPYSRSVAGLDIAVLAFESTWWDWPGTKAKSDRAGLNQISSSPYFGAPYLGELDAQRMESQIAAADRAHDIVLTMFHFGMIGEYEHTVKQEALAHRAIDSGSDAVIGAHSHTLQGIEVYDSAPIFYSLGNFVFDRPDTWSLDVMDSESALVTLDVSDDGVVAARVKPAVCDYGPECRPELLSPDDQKFQEIAEQLRRLSARTGASVEEISGELRIPLS